MPDNTGDLTPEARDAALGRHLRTLRRQRGWTQTTLHEKSGISEATIRSIEASRPDARRRNRSTLGALSRALGLPEDYLADYLDSPPEEHLEEHPEGLPGTSYDREMLDRLNETALALRTVTLAIVRNACSTLLGFAEMLPGSLESELRDYLGQLPKGRKQMTADSAGADPRSEDSRVEE